MRLQKYIAKCGVTSRRKAEGLILAGRVKVNERTITELGTKIEPLKDKVKIDNKEISIEEKKLYLMLNKPVGYVTSLSDEHNRKTVIDLLRDIDERVYPVGRLDIDTEGLLILTNDGDLTFKLTHPSFEVEKTYRALVEGIPSGEELKDFRRGLIIEGEKTAPAKIKIIARYEGSSLLEITIHEGRNRQVRKMCSKINHPVKRLKRIKFANLNLGKLKLGDYRIIEARELEELKNI